ncbi:PLC-like phosphodiesterase [Clavulina sp. PMI_390]|nr:PLC-like phosphodiesterase [Clavulina sp. PMI_390]
MSLSQILLQALPQVRIDSKYKLPTRNLAAFLGDFPDDRPLSDFLLPGTHDTLAYYGYPFSQCQSPTFPLEAQLLNGVRVLDIRLAVSANPDGSGLELIGYHGIISQRVSFVTVLAVIRDFLRAHPSECVVMSIKREQNLSKTPTILFSQLVKEAVYAERELWFLDNRIPRLGEVWFAPSTSKTGATDVVGGWPGGEHSGMGIHPTTWPDSYRGVFEWMCAGVSVYMQDWYAVPSFLAIPEKFELATAPLITSTFPWPFPPSKPPIPSLTMTYTSASSIPFALPPMIALGFGIWWGGWRWGGFGWRGVNERVRDWVLQVLEGDKDEDQRATKTVIRGWIMMDYVDIPGDLLPLLVECNYH